jgi:GTP-binding protein
MEIKQAEFIISAVKKAQFPVTGFPEVAFVGRSNVGKSSIINAITNRKKLVKVSSTPGKTKLINFFLINNNSYFVDLPGYGYAKVSKEKKSSWNEIIETYLYKRRQVELILLLVDIRHLPSEDDKIMYQWIRGRGVPHLIIATKADKVPRGQVRKKLDEIKQAFDADDGVLLIPFSSETKQGKDEIWNHIDNIIKKP